MRAFPAVVFRTLARLPGMALGLALWAGAANAGDFAERRILGFSPGGDYFAFELYGRQDGSGFPYADIFVIDTARDAWVGASPFRVLVHDESAPLPQARSQAMSKAEGMLQRLGIGRSGRLLASNPPAELSADPHRVTVNASRVVPPREEPWTFTLSEFPVKNDRCAAFSDKPSKGFRLQAQPPGGGWLVLHEDDAIPESRGCPLNYAISDVVIFEPEDASRVFAVLVSVYQFGFEGPDRRFIAVTRRLR